MAGIAAAAIGAGVGILGDVMSQSGQQSANRMNQQMMIQNEQWQERMSDTAVQRRKADLLAAGFNPLLATGDAASTPSVSQPNMQNPNQAFAGMGQQVTSAMQTASNIEMQQAQARQATAIANKTTSETPDTDSEGNKYAGANHILGNQQVEWVAANTGVAVNEAQRVTANINLLKKQTDGAQIANDISAQDLKYQRATFDAAVKLQNMSVQELSNSLAISTPEAEVMKSNLGPYLAKARMLLGVTEQAGTTLSTGAQAFQHMRNLIP